MSAPPPPRFFIIAGPNGAGKSTAAPFLLKDLLDIKHFLNADTIAAGLSAYDPDSVAFAAGRLIVQRMDELAAERSDFAVETTLATRSYAPRIRRLRAHGYRCQLLFLALPTPELALARVAQRVALGGHDIPEPVIRRRFTAGLRNLFDLYLPLVDDWQVYHNHATDAPSLIAHSSTTTGMMITDQDAWDRFTRYRDTP